MTHGPTTDDDVILPPTRAVLVRRLLLLALAGAAIVAACELLLFPWLEHYVGSASGTKARTRLAQVLYGFAAIGLLVAGWTIREGVRILHARRWPSHGAFVVRETAVLRGKAASWRGRLLIGLGVMLAASALYAAMLPRLLTVAPP